MNNEQIEQAAKDAIQKRFDCITSCCVCEDCRFGSNGNDAYYSGECGADDFNEGFKAGADWRINSVWHDNTEIPRSDNTTILVDAGSEHIKRHVVLTYYDYEYSNIGTEWFDWKDVIRWAYVSDLLP